MGRPYLIAALIAAVLFGPGVLLALGPVWIAVLIGAAVLWAALEFESLRDRHRRP